MFKVLFFLFVFIPIFVFGQYTIGNLPKPKERGQQHYVSNPEGILSRSTVDSLNKILQDLDVSTSIEFAIVVVGDYVGKDDFSFSHTLFNKWGIGKKENNKGLLLFVAKDRREYRFITGYGLEAELPDALLKRIGEQILVPNFRKDDYEEAIYLTVFAIKGYLKQENYDEANMTNLLQDKVSTFSISKYLKLFPMLLFFFGIFVVEWLNHKIRKNVLINFDLTYNLMIVIIRYLVIFILFCSFISLVSVLEIRNETILSISFLVILVIWLRVWGIYKHVFLFIQNEVKDVLKLENSYKQLLNSTYLWFLFNPLSWFQFFMIKSKLIELNKRLSPPDLSGNWNRIIRSDNSKEHFLSKGQQIEEKIGSRIYEIWENQLDGNILVIPWEINNIFGLCPKCKFYTLVVSDMKINKDSTYLEVGEGVKMDRCRCCNFKINQEKILLSIKSWYHSDLISANENSSSSDDNSRYSSGSGSSSSSSSSGGSSSSSSGSFGGGSSGGGGAGGRW